MHEGDAAGLAKVWEVVRWWTPPCDGMRRGHARHEAGGGGGDKVYRWRAQGKWTAVAGIGVRAAVIAPEWEAADHEEPTPFWRSSDGRAVERHVWL